MASATVSRVPPAETVRWPQVDALLAEVRRRFDPDRCLYVAYIIEAGERRESAYRLRQRAHDDGWQSSLYGDASGWVVRIGRSERLTRDALLGEGYYLDCLADTYGVTIRGVSVEDLEVDDPWATLAARPAAACGSMPAVAAAPAGSARRHLPPRPPARASIA